MKLTWRSLQTLSLVLLALLTLADPSLAGELFPYQPPSSAGGGPSLRRDTPARSRIDNSSAAASRSSEFEQGFSKSTRSLSSAERQELRSYLEKKIREADQQGDFKRADYYRALLRRGELE